MMDKYLVRDSALPQFRDKSSDAPKINSRIQTPPINNNTTLPISIIHCSTNWKLMKQDMQLEEKQNKKCIDVFVKTYVFKHLKFIP